VVTIYSAVLPVAFEVGSLLYPDPAIDDSGRGSCRLESTSPRYHPLQPARAILQALLLLNGVIYTTWTSHCDIDPYTGWIISYNAQTLKQTGVLNITPNGEKGAIWQSGAGPGRGRSRLDLSRVCQWNL
jgi:hypothetical protein